MGPAEILGELAEGQSASYLARLVQCRGVDFDPTADFLERVRRSGGEGILIERLLAAAPPPGLEASRNERPFDHLAKCSELIHVGAVEQAVPECRAAVDETPDSAWPNILLLRVLSEFGITPEERRKLLRRAAEADSNLVDIHRLLAMEDVPPSERQEEMQKVIALEHNQPIKAFSEVDPATFDHWASQSTVPESLSPEKQKQLRAHIEANLNNDQDLATAHLAVASEYLTLGEPENARVQIQEALRLEPGNPELHIALGRFYRSQHQVEAELAEFRTAANLAPYQNLPHRYLGEALIRERRIQEAIQQWKDLLTLSPRDVQASHSLVTIYLDRQDRAAGIAELRRSLKASSDVAVSESEFVDARFGDLGRLAQLLRDNHQGDEAAWQYAYLLRFKPDSSALHNNLGELLYAERRYEEAVTEYREAMRIDADNPDPHRGIARCLQDTHKLDEAIAEYRQALDLDSASTDSLKMLGMALAQKGELNAAIEQFQQYLAQDPHNPEALDAFAEALLQNGAPEEALLKEEEAARLAPGDPAIRKHLADVRAAVHVRAAASNP